MTTIIFIFSSVPMILFSVLAFWARTAGYYSMAGLMFLLTAGVSIALGLRWYDIDITNTGLSLGLMVIGYAFVSLGFAFASFFGRRAAE